MRLTTVLSFITLVSANCTINPTNPNLCPYSVQSTITAAQFDLNHAFDAEPAIEPLLGLYQNLNIYFHYDGNLVIYGLDTLWSSNIPSQDCSKSTCRLQWQTDGNLVIYIDGVSRWQAGTGGTGKQLTFTSNNYMIGITGAGSVGNAPLLFNTPTSGSAQPASPAACSGFTCEEWMCSACVVCYPAYERCRF